MASLEQPAGYVQAGSDQLEQRYVGVLTDGADWYLGLLEADAALHVVASITSIGAAQDVPAL